MIVLHLFITIIVDGKNNYWDSGNPIIEGVFQHFDFVPISTTPYEIAIPEVPSN